MRLNLAGVHVRRGNKHIIMYTHLVRYVRRFR